MLTHATFRGRLAFTTAILVLGLILTGSAAADPGGDGQAPEQSVIGWLDTMAQFYERNPHLKGMGGSGWKPYNRVRWLVERRLVDGELPPPGARWRAWEATMKRRRESTRAPRASWFSLGPTMFSGRMLDIEFHPENPDIVYAAAASGGLWKSIDNGLTWRTTTDDIPVIGIGAVAVLPENPDIVLIGTGEGNGASVFGVGLLKSMDGGETWSQTSLTYDGPQQSHGFNVIEVNPITGTILAGARDGLWRSTDQGDTWTQIELGQIYDVKWKPGDPDRVYITKGFFGDAGIRVSTDDGLTFAPAGAGQPASGSVGKVKIAVTPADPSVIYANFAHRNTSESIGIYRSTDDGATWWVMNTTNIAGAQGWYNLTVAVDPDDSNRILAGGIKLYRSPDGGITLIETGAGGALGDSTAVHWDHHAATYEPGSTDNVWVGCDGGVWRSTNDGTTWRSRREGLVTYQFYDICVAQSDPIFMMGGTQDNGIPGRVGLTSWFPSTLIADGGVCNVTPDNAQIVHGEWQFGNLVKSTNGGQSWFPSVNGLTGTGMFIAPVDQDQNDGLTLFTARTTGTFRTRNGAALWERVVPHGAVWISIGWMHSDVVWKSDLTAAWVSTDGGDTWTLAAPWSFLTGTVNKIHAHPIDPDAAFAVFSGYAADRAHIARTTDLGQTWEDVSGDFPAMPVNTIIVDPLDPGAWYIGTDNGVWASTNGGVNWAPYEIDLPNVLVNDLEINVAARKLVAGTYGRGVWEINLPEPVGVETSPGTAATLNMMLDPPFPNPLSGQTTFRFAIRKPGEARLEVFDAGGRLVDLVARTRGDGIVRTVTWSPDGLANGVYFVVLRAGDEKVRQKLIIHR